MCVCVFLSMIVCKVTSMERTELTNFAVTVLRQEGEGEKEREREREREREGEREGERVRERENREKILLMRSRGLYMLVDTASTVTLSTCLTPQVQTPTLCSDDALTHICLSGRVNSNLWPAAHSFHRIT